MLAAVLIYALMGAAVCLTMFGMVALYTDWRDGVGA